MASQVQERVTRASQRFFDAQKELYKALAEQARLELLNQATEDERIVGLTFTTEYEYDDEGGYFRSDTVYPVVNDTDYADFDYEFGDLFQQYGHEALCVLCGVDTESFAGEITIEQARERRF